MLLSTVGFLLEWRESTFGIEKIAILLVEYYHFYGKREKHHFTQIGSDNLATNSKVQPLLWVAFHVFWVV